MAGGGMIRVTYYPNPLDPHCAEPEVMAWWEGMTVEDAIPSRLGRRECLTITRGGVPLERTDALAEGDSLALAFRPGGGDALGAALAIGAGIFLGPMGGWQVASAWWGGLSATSQFVFGAGGLYALGKLLAPPPPGKGRSDEDSPVYGFSGPGNIRVEGQPVPKLYGLFRYPGTIINEFTRTRAAPFETDYYALVSFGEGPAYSIAGISSDTPRSAAIRSGDANFPVGVQLNGNDAGNFDGVAVAVRLGTPEQEQISGDELSFTDTEQSAAVGLGLLSTETTSQDNSTRAFDFSNYTTSTADDHFTAYGAAYSFTGDYDRFRCVVSFPAGLYRITSTGNIVATNCDIAIRYIELDGGGSPITSGGPEGDGYVRLPPESRVISSQRNAFSVEYEHPFYDPQTYAHPTTGRALILDRAAPADFGTKATPTVPTLWQTANANIDAVSVGAWIYPDDTTGGTIFSWVNYSSDRGFALKVISEAGGGGTKFIPRVMIGDDTTVTSYDNHDGLNFGIDIPTGAWSYVAFTYAGNYSGSNDRLRVYLNGAKVYEKTSSSVRARSPGTASAFFVGKNNASAPGGDEGFDGLIDALEVDNREWTSSDLTMRWQTGQGIYVGATATHVGLWQFDTTSSATAADSSARANNLTLTNGANVPAGANGKVLGAPSLTNTPARGRFKVEVVRVNNDSSHPNVSDDSDWSQVVGIIDEEFSYPSSPLLAIKVKASDQLNTTVPTITALGKWGVVPIWDGLSAANPSFYREWSRNPSWIALDIILDKRIGLGEWYAPEDVDIQSFQDFADYADELIYDLQGVYTGDALGDWTDITYTGSGGVGTLVVQFEATAYATLRWAVGDYVGFEGLPVVTTDINTTTTGGYEITAMDATAYTVTLAISLDAGTDPWTSGTALSAHDTVAGTAEGREPRYQFDGAFDEERPAWESLLLILSTGLAVPIRDGKRIRVKYEHPRSALDIIGHGSIVEGSFEVTYGGRKDRANGLTLEFLDEDQNYDRSTHAVDHPSIQNVTTLEGVRRESMFLPGICRRSQAARHGAFALNVNNDLVRTGRFQASVDSIGYEVGDVYVLSHDVTQWGESGCIYATDTDTSIKLDRSVTLAPATTYSLLIRNSATGKYETGTVTTTAGDVALGAALTVSAAYSWTPQRDDRYVLVVQGSETLVQITSITLGPDLLRDVEWMEYSADSYDLDWVADVDGPDADAAPAPNPLVMPNDPDGVTALERVVRGPGNSYETHLQVGWRFTTDDDGDVESTAVYVSIDDGPLDHVATVPGKQTGVDVRLDRTSAGSTATVYVQPRTSKGARRRPQACANASIVMHGIALPPTAPSALTAKMDGEAAVYGLTLGDTTAHHELRRGGWILGQPVATMSPGSSSTPPVANWASALSTDVPTVYARARSGAGFYSSAASLSQSIVPSGVREAISWITAAEVAWHSYVDGWRTAAAPPAGDPVLTGFEVTDDAVHGDYLTFDGASLTATYEVAYTAPSFDLVTNSRMSSVYVEAWYEAVQSYPVTAAEMLWPSGEPGFERWTAEGPLTVIGDEPQHCTLKVQINYHDGDGWSGWQDFVSGSVYSLTDAKFRLYATRPSTSSDLRVSKFVTRVRTQSIANNERTALQSWLFGEIIGAY